MTEHSFSLTPFPDSNIPNIPNIKITGTISRSRNILRVRFFMTGKINTIFFPEKKAYCERKDELWRTTCFEFFLALAEKPEYWEFNMSPSGDWNAYHMDAYRQVGLREETSIQRLQFSMECGIESVIVETTVNLTPFIQEGQQIQAEVTSVIADKNGHETYWALTHPGLHADFHYREGFIIQI